MPGVQLLLDCSCQDWRSLRETHELYQWAAINVLTCVLGCARSSQWLSVLLQRLLILSIHDALLHHGFLYTSNSVKASFCKWFNQFWRVHLLLFSSILPTTKPGGDCCWSTGCFCGTVAFSETLQWQLEKLVRISNFPKKQQVGWSTIIQEELAKWQCTSWTVPEATDCIICIMPGTTVGFLTARCHHGNVCLLLQLLINVDVVLFLLLFSTPTLTMSAFSPIPNDAKEVCSHWC